LKDVTRALKALRSSVVANLPEKKWTIPNATNQEAEIRAIANQIISKTPWLTWTLHSEGPHLVLRAETVDVEYAPASLSLSGVVTEAAHQTAQTLQKLATGMEE
jgi:hypothetical protein